MGASARRCEPEDDVPRGEGAGEREGEGRDRRRAEKIVVVVDRSRSNSGIDIVVAARSNGLGNCLRAIAQSIRASRRTGMMDTATWTTMEVYMLTGQDAPAVVYEDNKSAITVIRDRE